MKWMQRVLVWAMVVFVPTSVSINQVDAFFGPFKNFTEKSQAKKKAKGHKHGKKVHHGKHSKKSHKAKKKSGFGGMFASLGNSIKKAGRNFKKKVSHLKRTVSRGVSCRSGAAEKPGAELFKLVEAGEELSDALILKAHGHVSKSVKKDFDNLKKCATKKDIKYLVKLLIGADIEYDARAKDAIKAGDMDALTTARDNIVQVFAFLMRDSKHFSKIYTVARHQKVLHQGFDKHQVKVFGNELKLAQKTGKAEDLVSSWEELVSSFSDDDKLNLPGLHKAVEAARAKLDSAEEEEGYGEEEEEGYGEEEEEGYGEEEEEGDGEEEEEGDDEEAEEGDDEEAEEGDDEEAEEGDDEEAEESDGEEEEEGDDW